MESSAYHWWEQAEVWNPLLGDVCSSRHMASYPPLPHPIHSLKVAYSTIGFRSCLHAGRCRNSPIHGDSERFPSGRRPKAPRVETYQKSIWIKTGRPSMEPAPDKMPTKAGFHTEQGGWMCILLQEEYLYHLYWRYDFTWAKCKWARHYCLPPSMAVPNLWRRRPLWLSGHSNEETSGWLTGTHATASNSINSTWPEVSRKSSKEHIHT